MTLDPGIGRRPARWIRVVAEPEHGTHREHIHRAPWMGLMPEYGLEVRRVRFVIQVSPNEPRGPQRAHAPADLSAAGRASAAVNS
ncbi:hypothetical protein [Thiorhodococcus minor]|uniref:Uncharacterized protein n=1 Tax=Thiorhodococcus minor TaxID=57489 RepID=A0A6M0K6B9_9GAMM|nr:hypothetical protein [Thiorhodococcus minor]NEV65302.1 hypothetical protein [Thiorhodococcus minor]